MMYHDLKDEVGDGRGRCQKADRCGTTLVKKRRTEQRNNRAPPRRNEPKVASAPCHKKGPMHIGGNEKNI